MKAIAFSPAAETDISEIWDYTADRWGADQADSYTDAIRDACYALAQGVDQAVVSPAAISITAMAAGRSRSNCSGLDEAD